MDLTLARMDWIQAWMGFAWITQQMKEYDTIVNIKAMNAPQPQ
jgi:cold shock CspA family protein